MGQVQPALFRFDRRGAETVFAFLDRMIEARINDGFLFDRRVRDVRTEAPADAIAAARRRKIRHGTGVEGVFAVHEFRMQHTVALVQRRRFQIAQPFPRHQVFRARNAAPRDGRREIARLGSVMPLGAKQPVNPAVFVTRALSAGI